MESKNNGLSADPVGNIEDYINKLAMDNRMFDTKVQDIKSIMTEKFEEEFEDIVQRIQG